jgi:3-oxoacyl-[acyl-carrier protein] reductase
MQTNDKPLALVTGASRGIGAEIAKRLAADGYHVLINYRSNAEKAAAVQSEIEQAGGSAEPLAFDVSDFNAVQKALEPYREPEHAVSALVNNAGIRADALLYWMERKDWDNVLDIDLGGTFNVTRWVLAGMLAAKKGSIVNVSSTSGLSGMPGQVNYAAAKAGQIALTKSLAQEVGRKDIRVNAVAPGFIETDLTSELPLDEIKKRVPLRRLGTAREVADVVAFLCSPAASYITGETIAVNGGIYIRT